MDKDGLNVYIVNSNSDDYGTFQLDQHTPAIGKFNFLSSTNHQLEEHFIDEKLEQTALKKFVRTNKDTREAFFNPLLEEIKILREELKK